MSSTQFSKGIDPLSDTVVRQTEFDVTIGQCVVSDRNLARAALIRHKTLSNGLGQGLSAPTATLCFVPLS